MTIDLCEKFIELCELEIELLEIKKQELLKKLRELEAIDFMVSKFMREIEVWNYEQKQPGTGESIIGRQRPVPPKEIANLLQIKNDWNSGKQQLTISAHRINKASKD